MKARREEYIVDMHSTDPHEGEFFDLQEALQDLSGEEASRALSLQDCILSGVLRTTDNYLRFYDRERINSDVYKVDPDIAREG